MTRQVLWGWGRTPRSRSDVVSCSGGAVPWPDPGGRGLLPRGLGRAYGDAALNGGGTVLVTAERPAPVADPDPDGVVRLDAGVSLDTVLRAVVPKGWTVPVLPGTRFVTVGGAVACDVHGKNHHREGSIARHLESVVLDAPATGPVEWRPGDDEFAATSGGMGLTGVLRSVRLKLQRIETSSMVVDTRRGADLDEVMAALEAADRSRAYSVAWVDLLARGRALGRGVVTSGDHATLSEVDVGPGGDPLAYAPRPRARVPDLVPSRALGLAAVAVANEAWFRSAPARREGAVVAMAPFFHPLDALADWNRLYGRRGLVQHQFAVPDSAGETLRAAVRMLSDARAPVLLAVLKRFGPAGVGHLSFPSPGWTLALDLPASPRWAPLLDALDEIVVEAGGRVYLAKDARMAGRHVREMYPRLDEWRAVRDRLDPAGLLASDLDRRLDLSGRWG